MFIYSLGVKKFTTYLDGATGWMIIADVGDITVFQLSCEIHRADTVIDCVVELGITPRGKIVKKSVDDKAWIPANIKGKK
jgi:hypothetical protein